MYESDILCGISKGTFVIPHKISYPYIERCRFLSTGEYLRARKCFWNKKSLLLTWNNEAYIPPQIMPLLCDTIVSNNLINGLVQCRIWRSTLFQL